jgi:hypothetical protein
MFVGGQDARPTRNLMFCGTGPKACSGEGFKISIKSDGKK